MSFKITGIGKATPKFSLSNEQLSTMIDTTDEWISTRTGIKSRFIRTDESLLDLAAYAARMALNEANLDPCKLDLIICTTIGGDYLMPSLSCLLQKEIGAACPAFDVNAACTGFVYALDIAASYFSSNRANNILVVSADIMSNYIDWNDRSTCVLFGDGAGACVLTTGDNLLAIKIATFGDDKLLCVRGVVGNNPFANNNIKPHIQMNGGEIFKFAVTSMCRDIKDILKSVNLTLNDIKKIIPHQANYRIINSAKERLNITDDKMVCNVSQYGNTSSASIPIALSELKEKGEIKSGDLVLLTAFGGGLTTGTCIIKI